MKRKFHEHPDGVGGWQRLGTPCVVPTAAGSPSWRVRVAVVVSYWESVRSTFLTLRRGLGSLSLLSETPWGKASASEAGISFGLFPGRSHHLVRMERAWGCRHRALIPVTLVMKGECEHVA